LPLASKHATRPTRELRELVSQQGLLALARGGVFHALFVTKQAVRSYRTFSPLPRTPKGAVRRFLLCGTVPNHQLDRWPFAITVFFRVRTFLA